jgi:opacity protein-like surface antigen
MRHLGFVLGAVVLCALSTSAQAGLATSAISGTSAPATESAVSVVPAVDTLYAVASTPATPSSPLAEPAQPAPAAAPASLVQSVFQTYNLQAYVGYTFFRFYADKNITNNMNGLNLGLDYYPGGKWIGLDGEFIGTFGSIPTCTTKFVMIAGGPRFRWLGPRGIEVWAHGLAGYSNFLPQTALGNHSAFGFEAGAGVDLNIREQRWALRFAGDGIGTHYFNTFQMSPKFSAGVVFKF